MFPLNVQRILTPISAKVQNLQRTPMQPPFPELRCVRDSFMESFCGVLVLLSSTGIEIHILSSRVETCLFGVLVCHATIPDASQTAER